MPQFHLSKLNYNLHKYAAFLSCAVILLLGVAFLQPFSSDNSYAEDHEDTANGTYNGTNYSLTTTVSDLNLELKNVTPAGKAVYGKQTVNVVTTAPGGYQLYMQTSGNLAGTKDGSATSDSIAALSTNNSALDTNSWGYVTAAALSSTSTTLDEDMNKAATQAVWNTPPSTLTQIDATSSAASSGRDTDIYYGIKADNTLSGDNYSGTITYTTVANSDGNDGLLVTRGGSGYAGENNNTLTITTPIFTSASFATSDVAVTIKNSSGTEYTCTVSSVNTTNGVLQTVCSIPTTATASTYSVTVTVDKYGKTFTKASAFSLSSFTLSISSATPTTTTANTSVSTSTTINRSSPSSYDVKFGGSSGTSISGKSISGSTITGTISLAAGTYQLYVSATWNGKTYMATKNSALTVAAGNLSGVTYMQDATAANCAASTASTSTSITNYSLTDKRNSQKYYIRKFGNYCVMVENLYLEGGTSITSDTSHVSSSGYTIPTSDTSFSNGETTAKMYNGYGRYRNGAKLNGAPVDGAYYNWYAATAGGSTTYDICPKNWKIPTSSQWSDIASNSTWTQRFTSSNTDIFPGFFQGTTSPKYYGSYVKWWGHDNGNSSYYAYAFEMCHQSGLCNYYSATRYTHQKSDAYSVRCILPAS